MAALIKIILFFATLALTVIPAMAVTEGRNHSSDYLVWGFLGCCALIIVAQIVPLFRNARKQSKEAAEHTAEIKQR